MSTETDRDERLVETSKQNFYESPDILTQFFTRLSLSSKAAHHFLLTHGHGSGFGLFSDEDIKELARELFGSQFFESNTDKQKMNVLKEEILNYNLLFSSGLSLPEDSANGIGEFAIVLEKSLEIPFFNKVSAIEILTRALRLVPMQTLATAIENSFQKVDIKVKFIYTMNCFMQMFESGFVLKDQIEFYMGSENFQLFLGPSYDNLFADLATVHAVLEPNLHTIADDIIKNWERKYEAENVRDLLATFGREPEDVVKDISHVYLSATILNAYPGIKGDIDDLADYLMRHKQTLYPIVRKAVKKCHDVELNGSGVIDLKLFCRRFLLEKPQDGGVEERLKAIVAKIYAPGPLVASEKSTPSLCKPDDSKDPAVCPQGLSFFFPGNQADRSKNPLLQTFLEQFYLPAAQKPHPSDNYNWSQFVVDFFYANIPRQ